MRLFITGGTGYIGFSVATAFRRAGYAVWALTRSQESAVFLARNEINPVVGSLQQPDSFTDVAAESDVIVHAAIDYEVDSAALDSATVQTLLNAERLNPEPRKFIYTSGVAKK